MYCERYDIVRNALLGLHSLAGNEGRAGLRRAGSQQQQDGALPPALSSAMVAWDGDSPHACKHCFYEDSSNYNKIAYYLLGPKAKAAVEKVYTHCSGGLRAQEERSQRAPYGAEATAKQEAESRVEEGEIVAFKKTGGKHTVVTTKAAKPRPERRHGRFEDARADRR